MASLENKWHTLPCGARIRVLNGVGLALVIDMVNTPTGMPPTDQVALKEASELLGHQVELSSGWSSDITGMYKTANLQKKLVFDEPEQI